MLAGGVLIIKPALITFFCLSRERERGAPVPTMHDKSKQAVREVDAGELIEFIGGVF